MRQVLTAVVVTVLAIGCGTRTVIHEVRAIPGPTITVTATATVTHTAHPRAASPAPAPAEALPPMPHINGATHSVLVNCMVDQCTSFPGSGPNGGTCGRVVNNRQECVW
jgi:hypothetical protein